MEELSVASCQLFSEERRELLTDTLPVVGGGGTTGRHSAALHPIRGQIDEPMAILHWQPPTLLNLALTLTLTLTLTLPSPSGTRSEKRSRPGMESKAAAAYGLGRGRAV